MTDIDWDALWTSGRPQRTWPSEDVVRFCARRLTPGMRVLEAGCGNGANLWFLQEAGYLVTGVDCSREALRQAAALAAQHGLAAARLVQASLGALARPTPPEFVPGRDLVSFGALAWPTAPEFDAIVDCRASQHTPWSAHAGVYGEYLRLLKPGGWLFLLHLDDRTTDAQQAEGRTAGEDWTWDDIADGGVYAHNGTCCMPPALLLLGAVSTAGFAVARAELLGRETLDAQFCGHLAVDAQAPGPFTP